MRLLKSIPQRRFCWLRFRHQLRPNHHRRPGNLSARFAGFRPSSSQAGGSRHRSRRNACSPLSLLAAKPTKALNFSSEMGTWTRDRKILDSLIPTENGHCKASQLSKLPRSSRPVGWACGVLASRHEFIRMAFTAVLEIKQGLCFLTGSVRLQRSRAIPRTKCRSSSTALSSSGQVNEGSGCNRSFGRR
jgi:hypothetical protein